MERVIKTLLIDAVKITGSYEPDETVPCFEENLTADEADDVRNFLSFVVVNHKRFGTGNIDEVYAEYKSSDKRKEFEAYVTSFYNHVDGIYPIADKATIVKAVDTYMGSKPLSEIEFDSIDRENVRSIIEPIYEPLK